QPAHRLDDQEHDKGNHPERHPRAQDHAPERLANVLGAPNLAVEGRPPVGPEQIESEKRQYEEDRAQREEPKVVGCVASLCTRVDRSLVSIVRCAKQAPSLSVERGLVVAMALE